MTLREMIEEMLDMVKDEPLGDQIEVVAVSDDKDDDYTPVIGVGPCNDGIRRMTIL